MYELKDEFFISRDYVVDYDEAVVDTFLQL